jgi:hypothetical protein
MHARVHAPAKTRRQIRANSRAFLGGLADALIPIFYALAIQWYILGWSSLLLKRGVRFLLVPLSHATCMMSTFYVASTLFAVCLVFGTYHLMLYDAMHVSRVAKRLDARSHSNSTDALPSSTSTKRDPHLLANWERRDDSPSVHSLKKPAVWVGATLPGQLGNHMFAAASSFGIARARVRLFACTTRPGLTPVSFSGSVLVHQGFVRQPPGECRGLSCARGGVPVRALL